jgi:hypothetical protein
VESVMLVLPYLNPLFRSPSIKSMASSGSKGDSALAAAQAEALDAIRKMQ